MTEAAKPSYDLSFIRTFLEANPQAYKELGVIKPGRPKGVKNKPAEPITQLTPEQLAAIGGVKLTAEQSKALKKKRAPRNLSDEQKAIMLENLRKGREALQKKKAEGTYKPPPRVKSAPVQLVPQITVPVQPPKPRKQRKPKAIKEVPLATSEDESEIFDETSDTEPEVKVVRKRLQKRKELIREIDQELSRIPQPTVPVDRYTQQLLASWR